MTVAGTKIVPPGTSSALSSRGSDAIPPKRRAPRTALFGHEKGAFTGADRARAGAFELANGGSVFLDEIGELRLELQPRLLRALERREVRRLGASHPTEVDVRIISATHKPLRELTESKRFRGDLYYRLAEVLIELPPLRERRDDVPLIAQHIVDRERPDQGHSFQPDAIAALKSHEWPGNVRELRNLVRRGLELCTGTSISAKDLGLKSGPPKTEVAPSPQPAAIEPPLSELPLEAARARWNLEFEREYVQALLERHGGDFERAARAAKVHLKTLQRVARKHGITGR